MARNYIHTVFTAETRALQEADGSRPSYARMEAGADGSPDLLTERETGFIAARDSFYMASVTSEGWPYVQHRGGPPGFLVPLGENRLAFADFRGNRQHVSTANLQADPRVALILVDYPHQRRLKLLGRARMVAAAADPALIAAVTPPGYDAIPERACVIDVVGFDWNCPQHIVPRFTEAELAPLTEELTRLRAENERLRSAQAGE